jgi:hypothetical protein
MVGVDRLQTRRRGGMVGVDRLQTRRRGGMVGVDRLQTRREGVEPGRGDRIRWRWRGFSRLVGPFRGFESAGEGASDHGLGWNASCGAFPGV